MVSLQHLKTTLEEIRAAGLYKTERVITTPQSFAECLFRVDIDL